MNQVSFFYSYSLVKSQIIYCETHKTVIQRQKYLWNVFVLQLINQQCVRQLNRKQQR